MRRALIVTLPLYRFLGSRTEWTGLGAMHVAQELRNRGWDAKVLNGDYARTDPLTYREIFARGDDLFDRCRNVDDPLYVELEAKIRAFEPDWLGFYVNEGTQIQARMLRQRLADMRVALGGPYATMNAAEASGSFDQVVVGEVEPVVDQLIEGRTGVIVAPPADLSQVSLISTDVFYEGPYDANEFNQFMTSRGCPFPCTFCSARLIWKTTRFLPVSYLEANIDQRIAAGLDLSTIQFVDDTLLIKKAHCAEVLAVVKDRGLKFFCDARVTDIKTPETARMLADAGCVQVKLGVEAGTQAMLDGFDKRITLDDVRRTTALLNDAGVPFSAYVLLGQPGFGEKDYMDSLAFMETLNASWYSVGVTYPYRHTKIHDQVADRFPAEWDDGALSALDTRLRQFWGVTDEVWERAVALNDGRSWIRS